MGHFKLITCSSLLYPHDQTAPRWSRWRALGNAGYVAPMFAVVLSNCRWMIGKGGWWNDLDQTMTIDDFCDYINIHRFDPPDQHLGNAGPLFGNGRTNLVEKIQSANLWLIQRWRLAKVQNGKWLKVQRKRQCRDIFLSGSNLSKVELSNHIIHILIGALFRRWVVSDCHPLGGDWAGRWAFVKIDAR